MAHKVKLRTKPITGNRLALYLDYYPAIPHPVTDELTRREFLNMYLFDEVEMREVKYTNDNGNEIKRFEAVVAKNGRPKPNRLTQLEKLHNEETFKLADQIRMKRENQLNKPEIYTDYEKNQLKLKTKQNSSFLEYFTYLKNHSKSSDNYDWVACFNHLHSFSKGKLKFSDVDLRFCDEFREYMLKAPSHRRDGTPLSQNTISSYFGRFKNALKQAYREGYLEVDLYARVDRIKEVETHRHFLTLDELNSLVKTECEMPILKNAALFSALTGVRFSDIEKLRWSEVEYIPDNGYFLRFTQRKTGGVEMMPISDQAYTLMGGRKAAKDKVFSGLTYSAYSNKHLAKWLGLSGITKKVTFHCFRHTFATLQLSKGTDIYTVSKMLGHRSLKTTQIYAKVMDASKREAADKIKLKF